MQILNWFKDSIHPIVIHDGVRIFRCNQLALDLFRYETEAQLCEAGIAAIIAPESRNVSAQRVKQLRKRPDENLPDAELTFIRRDGSRFVALTHTRTLRWAFQEGDNMVELDRKLHTDIVFYSWVSDDIKEVETDAAAK